MMTEREVVLDFVPRSQFLPFHRRKQRWASADELADAKAKMTEEQYASEFECDPYAAIMGAFYGKDITLVRRRDGLQSCRRSPASRYIPHGISGIGIRPQSGSFRWLALKSELSISTKTTMPTITVVSCRHAGTRRGIDFVPHDARVHE